MEKKEKKKKSLILNILLVIFILIFVACGLYIFNYFKGAADSQKEVDELISLKNDNENDTSEDIEIEVNKEKKKIMKKYKKLYKKNKDIIGWIEVKNSMINYPVMQTKKDNEFYLHRNFKKESDINGLPFLDAACDIENKNSNLMIYGHHMKSGMMFAHLLDFQQKDFYAKHKIIYLDTLYEEREYEVVAAFYSQIFKENSNAFKYYEYPGDLSKEKFQKYVKNVKKLSIYDTGVNPKYGEQLLTLVTCAYQTEEGRFVVVARRIK